MEIKIILWNISMKMVKVRSSQKKSWKVLEFESPKQYEP